MLAQTPALNTEVEHTLDAHTPGNPRHAQWRWPDLQPPQISALLAQRGYAVSTYWVKQWLRQHDDVQRQLQKRLPTGICADRESQFRLMHALRADYRGLGYPISSIDIKKKEAWGNLYRAGRLYTSPSHDKC